jgi:gluconolactonase
LLQPAQLYAIGNHERKLGRMASFKAIQPSFQALLGEHPKLESIISYNQPMAFEAGIYLPQKDELFVTSLLVPTAAGIRGHEISRICLGSQPVSSCTVPSNGIDMANGGTNYRDGMIFCAQGSMNGPSGLFFMSATAPYENKLLIGDFNGRPFNSTNDVVVQSDDTIWFTDPAYGYAEGYRPRPSLPNQVYRFNPKNGNIRVVADDLGHPNGICFSPDEKIVYVTDTDQIWGDGSVDETRVATMYVNPL